MEDSEDEDYSQISEMTSDRKAGSWQTAGMECLKDTEVL